MDTLISNVTVVTMNPKMDVLFGAYIGIQDGKILLQKTVDDIREENGKSVDALFREVFKW